MAGLRDLAILGGITTVLLAPAALHAQRGGASSPGTPTVQAFAGVWDYNANESVNAATGRPEQNPRSATVRTPGRRGGGPDAGAPGAVRPSFNPGGGVGAEAGGLSIGLTPDMMQESRDVTRDLLEVPEELRIRVEPHAVTFVDDLERERTYPTDGVKKRYQLGAARFDAAVSWKGPQLLKRIDGPYGFHMTETYFLSPDGQRLFVIIRLGDPKPKKDDPIVGVNRVYDRIE
jgi:hypothetical protein